MLTKAIQKAKGDEEKKVGVSLKMAETFRNKLQTIADKNNVSLNALIIGMLETVYESKEANSSNYMDEYTKFSEIVLECNEYIEKGIWRVQIWYILMFQEWMLTAPKASIVR